jgi:hypothetical protein
MTSLTPGDVTERADLTGTSDVVVLLAGSQGSDAIREGVRRVTAGLRLLGDDLTALIGCTSDSGVTTVDDGRVRVVALEVDPIDRFPVITSAPRDAYRALFSIGRTSNARAMAVIATHGEQLTPALVRALVQPVVVDGFDVVAPGYERQVFDGLLNAAVVYPLTRALYGRRIQGQLGVDFCFSPRVAARWGTGAEDVKPARPTWLIPQAVVDGHRVCQAHVGARIIPAPDSVDLGTLLVQVLGSLFADMEQRAAFWQRVQRSQPVPVFGTAPLQPAGGDEVDVRPMIESFGLAYRNLQSVWTLVLPPATLVELKRLTIADAARFRLADDLWARIVFDFTLAYRLRTINRDHLLKALAPLYLAWIASYATEVQSATRQMADVRLEQLCQAFETEKPYLVRRWRWPDRFNP